MYQYSYTHEGCLPRNRWNGYTFTSTKQRMTSYAQNKTWKKHRKRFKTVEIMEDWKNPYNKNAETFNLSKLSSSMKKNQNLVDKQKRNKKPQNIPLFFCIIPTLYAYTIQILFLESGNRSKNLILTKKKRYINNKICGDIFY